MPSVTITLSDTPTGGIAIKTDFTPAAGNPCSAAQAAALDIIRRTAREYGLVNADAPHRRANRDCDTAITCSADTRQ